MTLTGARVRRVGPDSREVLARDRAVRLRLGYGILVSGLKLQRATSGKVQELLTDRPPKHFSEKGRHGISDLALRRAEASLHVDVVRDCLQSAELT